MVYLLRLMDSMNVQRTAAAAFTAEFENEQELRDEHRADLSFGALRLLTAESVALHTALLVIFAARGLGRLACGPHLADHHGLANPLESSIGSNCVVGLVFGLCIPSFD
ncbi:MAG TPA: hypothetical protein VGS96_01455, partial [Thermoanaerobaculia bacterium]|nr:hypothetical protein [Thermoanaerobaculia bacterium]